MMHENIVKLLIQEANSKKIIKITKILLKLFFLTRKLAKVLTAERFFGAPTHVTELFPAQLQNPLILQ